ncbi:MAG: peptidoglycan D,D-transpeptidase FtsI family protein [Acetatifactor sp.]
MSKQKSNKFSIKMQKKLVVLFLFVLLAFAGLSVRLFWLAREKENQYQKQVLSQQEYSSTTLPYRRGDIVDARGTKLATSEKVYNLVIDAKVMNTELSGKKPYLEPTLEALGQYFELDMSAIREHVTTNTTSSWYVPLKRLSYDEISGFLAAQEENSSIKGVWFEEEYKRVYPYGSLAADAIGFTSTDGQGNYGLEEYYNDVLNGINGREYGYLNDDLALERTVKAAVDGNTIHTTIDTNVQMIVEKYLQKFMEEHKNEFKEGNGAENVGCIMMWVDTGEILAMASYPTYDLNDTRNTNSLLGSMMVEQVTNANGYYEIKKNGTVINESVLDSMSDDQIYLNLNNLWKNYCISNTYEPGSTAKPFTVAAALETGAISPNATFECNGSLEIGGYTIKCHNRYDGTLTLQGAVAKSCNVAMMRIGQTLGKEQFCEYQEIFNFGLKTNIDLAGEARTASLIYDVEDMGPTDLATNTFGQNFNVTMIQLMTGFCSLINGGYYYEPHMVDKITNAAGATVQNIEPRVLKQTISETTSAYIRQYCTAVVTEGTGKTARPAGYMIGGKTGTAETIDPNTHQRSATDHVVSFIGFAPADEPQIAIYVVVDRPNVSHQGDAKYATGIVRNILTEALPYLNIFMTEELSEEEVEELEARQLEITTQYTEKPEDEGLEDEESGQGTGNNAGDAPQWMSFPVDPESGYRVDPATGDQYDAQTGILIGSGETNLGGDVPINPNIE